MKNINCIEEVGKIKIALDELRNRNILLKEQLSDALSREVSTDFVEKAEWYQQCFLETDQVIDILRHDINVLLEKMAIGNSTPDKELQCSKLKVDVKKLGRSTNEISRSFRTFLAEDPAN